MQILLNIEGTLIHIGCPGYINTAGLFSDHPPLFRDADLPSTVSLLLRSLSPPQGLSEGSSGPCSNKARVA